MLETLTREDFMDNILKENSEIIHKYMEENDVTLKSVTDEVWEIIFALPLRLHLEVNTIPLKLKEFNNYLGVRLGYYKIRDNPNERELEKFCEQCSLIPTDRGMSIKEKYSRLSN